MYVFIGRLADTATRYVVNGMLDVTVGSHKVHTDRAVYTRQLSASFVGRHPAVVVRCLLGYNFVTLMVCIHLRGRFDDSSLPWSASQHDLIAKYRCESGFITSPNPTNQYSSVFFLSFFSPHHLC